MDFRIVGEMKGMAVLIFLGVRKRDKRGGKMAVVVAVGVWPRDVQIKEDKKVQAQPRSAKLTVDSRHTSPQSSPLTTLDKRGTASPPFAKAI